MTASYRPVAAALRALEVLAAVSALDGQASLAAIHARTGIAKPTVLRMLETLVAGGYVVREAGGGYRITGRTVALGSSFDRPREIARLSAPLLARFREEIGWPSDIAVFDHDAMLVIGSSRDLGPLSFNRAPGYRAPVFGTSLGLCFAAHCEEEVLARLVAAAAADPAPWNGLARDPAALEAALARIRRDGIAEMDPAYSQGEYGNRVSSVGVAVLGRARVYASINIIYFRRSIDRDAVLRDLAPRLRAVAAELAALLDAQATDLGEARRGAVPGAGG